MAITHPQDPWDREHSPDSDTDAGLEDEDASDAILKAREPLRSEIQELAAAHRHDQPLPFSDAELMVMALVDTDRTCCTRRNIKDWILESFSQVDSDSDMALIRGKVGHVTGSHYVPLIDVSVKRWTVDAKHARIFLSKWLEPERKGIFPFLELLPELRNRIYQMVLVFPRPAIAVIDAGQSAIELRARHRDMGQTLSPVSGFMRRDWLDIGMPSRILKNVSVCNWMDSEAAPIFYGVNTFEFHSSSALLNFVRVTSTNRLKHLKKLHVRFNICSELCDFKDDSLRSAIETIHRVTALDKITIKACGNCRSSTPCCGVLSSPITTADAPVLGVLARLACKAKRFKVRWHYIPESELFKSFKDYILEEVERLKLQEVENAQEVEKVQEDRRAEDRQREEDAVQEAQVVLEVDRRGVERMGMISAEDTTAALKGSSGLRDATGQGASNERVMKRGSTRGRQARLDAIREARRPLRGDIQDLVARLRDKPNFTPAELTVMAIIDTDKEHSNKDDILRWIYANFPRYRSDLITEVLHRIDTGTQRYWDVDTCLKRIHRRFGMVFEAYDVPLKPDMSWTAWTADANQARVFLRRRFESQRKGVFRFLDLPAELRNRVYEMMLIFSEPGIRTLHSMSGRGLEALARDVGSEDQWLGFRFPIHNLAKVLSITLVCKQTMSEAVPIFCGGNTWNFESKGCVMDFLKRIAPERLRFVKKLQLRINLRRTHGNRLDKALGQAWDALHDVVSLDLLKVKISDRLPNHDDRLPIERRQAEAFAQLAPFHSLTKLASRAKEVKVSAGGFCDSRTATVIEQIILEEAEKIKAESNKAEST
ncbi:hypothetical protein PRZ48_012784 [Zasmidium cellare]|uniref:Fork-head domain-containing protein n=1 Tax=Zasmidium cellare TaxID=395010 RepID=A0ABR0E620_ZASCE|nr:hypothetical protein PRZ48_012784 [Zasmidium cellare]